MQAVRRRWSVLGGRDAVLCLGRVSFADCCLWEREGAFPIVLSVSLVSLTEALGMGLVSPVIF